MSKVTDVDLPRHVRRRLRRLADPIPPVVGCSPRCSDCCYAASWSLAEAALVANDPRATGVEWTMLFDEHRQAMMMVPSRADRPGPKCPFSTEVGCSIYDLRPLVCRLFGAIAPGRLDCPHGRRAARPLSVSQEGRIMVEYYNLTAPVSLPVPVVITAA